MPEELGPWDCTDHKKRIEELEKKLEAMISLDHTVAIMGINRRIGELKKQISELGDKLQKCGVKWDFRLDELNGFIEELKAKDNEKSDEEVAPLNQKNSSRVRYLPADSKPSEPKIPAWVFHQEYKCDFTEKEPTEKEDADEKGI